jgi:hypothetical protein
VAVADGSQRDSGAPRVDGGGRRRHVDAQSVEAIGNGTLGVVGLSLAAALLSSSRAAALSVSGAAVVGITIIRARLLDEPPLDLVGSAFVAMIVIVFGSQLMEWAKEEITGKERRFDNFFDHVPVPLWEEDSSAVARWLDSLRAGGITDLRAQLETNPGEIRHGASLIRVTDVNAETARFLEAPDRASLLGPLDPNLIVEDGLTAIAEELVAVWEGRSKLRVRLTGADMAGHVIEGYLLMAAADTGSGIDWRQVVVAIVDMSDQWEAQRRLEEIVDSKDRFVAAVSHELRTPLTAVIGFADELRDGLAVSADERDELLSLIADQAREVGDIVEDLLVAAQANIGKVRIALESIDLERVVSDLVAGLDGAHRRRPLVDADHGVAGFTDPPPASPDPAEPGHQRAPLRRRDGLDRGSPARLGGRHRGVR